MEVVKTGLVLTDINKIALVGECKFKNEKIDKGVYETLLRRSGVIAGKYHVKKLLFFSLSGYTEWFRELKNEAVVLFTLEDMYDEKKQMRLVQEYGIELEIEQG